MLSCELNRAIKNVEYLADELKGVTANSAQQIIEGYAILGNFIQNHLDGM